MQSGRISPIIRQFFTGTTSAKSATDSHSQQKENPQREPEREPTPEEALKALELLSKQEEFLRNSLSAELREAEGHFTIIVSNIQGSQLRAIRGVEILRILAGAARGSKTGHLGGILDRRI